VTKYRLASLRDARLRDERVRRADVATAIGDAEATAAAAARARRRAEALSEELARVPRGPGAAHALVLRERYAARLRRDREAAFGEVARAAAVHAGQLGTLDAAQVRLARSRADKLVIERHFERWRDEQRKLVERRE
jgi:hypothetical protein